MGANNSVVDTSKDARTEIRNHGHPKLFYEGMIAATNGRYTESEVCFHKLLYDNPQFKKYCGLLSTVEQQWRQKKAIQKMASGAVAPPHADGAEAGTGTGAAATAPGDAPAVSGESNVFRFREGTDGTAAAAARATGTSGSGSSYLPTGNTAAVLDVPSPLDADIEPLMNLFQQMQDVEFVYTACKTAKARPFSCVYAQISCVWHQIIICFLATQLRQDRARALADGTARTANAALFVPSEFADMAGNKYLSREDVDRYIDLLHARCVFFLINSSINYSALALAFAEGLDKGDGSMQVGTKKEAKQERVLMLRRQTRVYANIGDLCQLLIDFAWSTMLAFPDEYISRVLRKVLPPAPKNRGPMSRTQYGGEGEEEDDEEHDASEGAGTSETGLAGHRFHDIVKLLQCIASGKGGHNFHVEGCDFTPYSPVAIPLRRMNLPMRLAFMVGKPVLKSKLGFQQPPTLRAPWIYTKLTLLNGGPEFPTSYPGTDPFYACHAFPQYFRDSDDGILIFNKVIDLSKSETSDQFIEMVLEYTRGRRVADDAPRLAVLDAAEGGSTAAIRRGKKKNEEIDVTIPRILRNIAFQEFVMCLKPLLIIAACCHKLGGEPEKMAVCASAVVLATACVRGADASERLRLHKMLKEMGLL